VAGLALAMRLAFAFRAPPFITNDSLSYLLPGFDLARGLGFEPILKRPPLYPAFVGGVIALFGEELRALTFVQHLLGVAIAILAYAAGHLLFGRAAGLVGGLLTAMSAPLLVTEQYLMSETLFGALLLGAVVAFLRAVRRPSAGWFALVGVLVGLAALARPIAQLVAVLLALSLPFLVPRWRPALLHGGLLLGTFALTVIPWMARNQVVQGTFAIAGGAGEGLAVRTIRYEQRFDFREPPGGDADPLLARARRIYRDEASEDSAFELARRLREELGVTEVQADGLMRRIALEAILRQPGYYLRGTVEMFAETFVGRPVRLRQDWVPWRNIVWEDRVAHLLPSATPTEDRAFRTAEALVSIYDPARPPLSFLVVPLFALGAASGLAGGRRPVLVAAVLVLGLLFAGAALIGIEWRYRYPLDPLINVLAAGGLVVGVRWLAARWPVGGRRAIGGGASAPAARGQAT
jgi:4-amino-4-deoxy-L-arabinose transferase-like glycosyltransferase